MPRERRYALTAIEGPTNVPGLTQDAISGISYQVDSSGTRTPLGGGDGSLPSWWTVDDTAKTVEMAGSLTLSPPGVTDVPSKIEMPLGSLDLATPFAQWYADDGTKVFEFNSDSDLDVVAPTGWGPAAFILKSVDFPDSYVSLRGWSGDDAAIWRVTPNSPGADNTAQLNGDGSLMITGSEQDAAVIHSGQVYIYLDPTNGAAKLKFQAKQANGTVRTGEVALT